MVYSWNNFAVAATIACGGSLAACSPVQPIASPLFDGRYVGTRQSNSEEACGITNLRGKTSANVKNGEISLPLFGTKTQLDGTVGSDGAIRAWGMWSSQETAHFPSMTTFVGQITGNYLEGEASNFKCNTTVHLHKMAETVNLPLPPRPPQRKKVRSPKK
jgi:hypothetical protein